jgi:hypothetical protein
MQDSIPRKQPKSVLGKLRWGHPDVYDAVSMTIYVTVVYLWALNVYPQGRDFALLAGGGEGLPTLLTHALRLEMALFGTWIPGYHLVNMALMLLCMECVFYVTRFAVKGPFWLGTLAAVLFMANPVHTEAMASVTGVLDLLPCLLALAALLAYTLHVKRYTWVTGVTAWAAFAAAVASSPANASLILVLILIEVLVLSPENRHYKRLIPFCFPTGMALWGHGASLIAHGFSPKHMFAPLYFLLYPIGFLPESARRFHEYPVLGWVAAAAILLILAIIYRKARRPAILFGLLAMLSVRIFSGGRPIDPVHLVGGGQLLLANALFCMALVALFHRIMDHPRWRGIVVSGTTALCLVFFGMQISAVLAWRASGLRVEAFQRQATQAIEEKPGAIIGVCPDYQFYQGAPTCLSESIRYNTLFSKALSAQSLLPVHRNRDMTVTIEEWSRKGGIVRIDGVTALDIAPWPYLPARGSGKIATEGGMMALMQSDETGFTVGLAPMNGSLPVLVLPGDDSTQERTPPEGPAPRK